MTQIISKVVLCLVPFALLCTPAHSQDIPAVVTTSPSQGFQLPTENGTFHYALTFTEGARIGYYGKDSDVWATDFSGDAGYLSRSEKHPFSMVYSGGYIHNSGGQESSVFQNLNLSQTLITRLWNINIADAVSYLPETPSSGLSGIPGLGDVGVTAPPVGTDTGQDILSRTGQRVTNSTNVSVQRQLTGSTALQGGGGYFLQRFLSTGNNTLDDQSLSAQATVSHRIDALNQAHTGYSYSHYTNQSQGQPFAFTTQTVTVGYTRQINRRLSANASVGPQFLASSGSPLTSSPVNVSIDAGAAYTGKRETFNVTYTRGVRNGSGITQGSFADSVFLAANRPIGEFTHISASGGYTHNSSVDAQNAQTQHLDFETIIANVEVSRTILQNVNAYLSYGLQNQTSSTLAASTAAFSGTSQSIGFGITYSPRQLHLGH